LSLAAVLAMTVIGNLIARRIRRRQIYHSIDATEDRCLPVTPAHETVRRAS